MTHLSLFSGVAGIDLAAHWAGFETVQFVERDQFCQKVLAKNFPGVPIHDDVTTFDGSRCRGVDLVSAGFPCQPHSLAGKRLASGDERDLWSEVVRILGEAKPRWFLGENVPGLLTSESGNFFGRVVDDLAEMGFSVGWCVYGACDVGAIHRRNRVFIVAYSSGAGVEGQGQRRAVTNGDATDPINFRLHDVQEKGLDGQDDKERTQGRKEQPAGSGVPQVATNSESIASRETSETVVSARSQWLSRDWVGSSDWERTGRGNWRGCGIEPTICKLDDDVPDRVARLKALGNAVVPAQIYPILLAIKQLDETL